MERSGHEKRGIICVRVAGLQLNLSESPCDNKIYTYKIAFGSCDCVCGLCESGGGGYGKLNEEKREKQSVIGWDGQQKVKNRAAVGVIFTQP